MNASSTFATSDARPQTKEYLKTFNADVLGRLNTPSCQSDRKIKFGIIVGLFLAGTLTKKQSARLLY